MPPDAIAGALVLGGGTDGTSRSYDATTQPVGHWWRSSRHVAVLATVMWASTWWGEHLGQLAPLRWYSLAILVVAVVFRAQWRLILVSAALVGLSGGSDAWNGNPSVQVGDCNGIAVVRKDPTWVGAGVGTVLEIRQQRFKVIAYGSPGRRLAARLTGESVRITGTCMPLSGSFTRYDSITHVVGRINVTSVSEEFGEGSLLGRASNRMRRALVQGVHSMSQDTKALFTGLIIGDDRDQSREMVMQFRGTGLSHLTAVSGQNVAFLLAVCAPLLSRRRPFGRWCLTMGILVWFVVLTRAEPSVLRAAVMAGVIATNTARRSAMNARTVLSLTVCVLLIVDPMLAWSVGFGLSVGATAGLAWLSAPLGRIVGSHGMLASTLAAQVGTFPITWGVFQNLPVIALIANPLALAVAGAVMMIGLPLALLAAVVPQLEPLISLLLSVPVIWVASVARVLSNISPRGPWNAVCWVLVLCVLVWRWQQVEAKRRSVAM